MSKRKNSQPEQSGSKRRRSDDYDTSDDDDADENSEIVESSVVDFSQPPRETGNVCEPAVGVIKRISLFNFMCHNRLEVKFGSHVNFIVGRNGSGKSAIVTALIVGLGGKASATNRGNSVKSFIKSGKSSSWVEVCLNNSGRDGYKPEVYGNKITVRRKFSAEGSSSYSIRSASGQQVSTKREELSRITDHLNIQVDNPVSILNQDTSRNFLNTKSAGDKFKFFMKATQLEQMNTDYEEVHKKLEYTKGLISSKQQTLPKLNLEVREWENKCKSLAAVSDLKLKVRSLKNEMAWAEVGEIERSVRPVEKSLQAEEASLPRFKDKVNQTKNQQEESEKLLKELNDRLIECGKEVQTLEPVLQEKKKQLQRAKESLVPVMNQLKTYDRELKNTKQERQQCQKRIEELKTIASHDYEADRRERERQIGELETKRGQLESRRQVLQHERDQYRAAVAMYKSEETQLEAQMKTKLGKARDIKKSLHTLRAAKNDRLQRFGYYMPDIIRKIQTNARRFHKVPKGPLGACFDLVDPKWALATECCLKSLISSFVCHDHHDEKILEDIFKESDCPRTRRPTIITCAFTERIHDVNRYRVQCRDYPCMIDVVKCDDPVVINTLIDQRGVENVLLVEDSNDARELMMRNPPRNARECFTMAGDQVFCQPTFRYYSSDKTVVRFLMADVQEQITLLEQDETLVEGEMNALKKQKDIKAREIARNQQEERKCQTQLNKVEESLTDCDFDLRELRNIEDPEPVDVTTLEEEVVGYNKRLEELEGQRNQVEAEKSVLEEKLAEAQEGYKKVERDIRERSDNGIPLRDEISHAQEQVANAQRACKHYTSKLKEQEKKIQELKKKVEKHKKDVEEGRQKAEEICPRIETERTVSSIENEVTQIQRRIEEEEEQHGNEEEILETYKQKKDKLKVVRQQVGKLQKYVEKMDEVMDKRHIAYMKMRKLIASRVKYLYLAQMAHREYSGRLNFDFDKQTLEIVVNTDLESKDRWRQGGETKSLSGGERSFSTVCFILSLWEAMESPFRCLDEFDVFMDMVNRRISMDMMMETADMHKDRQFVFLTPQDMRSVRKISNVQIFRMPDPERSQNQGTLPFTSSQA